MISEGYVANGAKVYISSRDAKACDKACAELNALGKQFYITSTIRRHLLTRLTMKALGQPMRSRPISTSWKTANASPTNLGSAKTTWTSW